MTEPSLYKNQAKRLRDALAADGVAVSHSRALELVAKQHGARDWNTLAATPAPVRATPFDVGDAVRGAFNGNPAKGRVIGMEETIKPDL